MASTKILAVASGGGHWVQLMRLLPAFQGFDTVFVTVQKDYIDDVKGVGGFRVVLDATRWEKVRLFFCALQIIWIILRERPQVVVSTGAAPGLLAIIFGYYFGAKTVWIDSIANVEEMSMSGKFAKRYSKLWLTQWSHLAKDGGPVYFGGVL